ncbi:hypothetical protein DL89DRAFT_256917 [Linderina pennispora]|uniref:F-box domain-containing protein n=1 Tax=Linderina pennispora TaxID=61395 RepID=A0A1Y1WBX6_9FUNG|nr:uncharacterized protein DL89DRAFT_256917 [Linderina pennispora]ORX70726.1 hypothetical protein DL89DRAFT_256917 [Linderina pennispora]
MPNLDLNQLPTAILVNIFATLCRDILHKYALISNYWEVMDIATVCRLWNYYIPSFTYRSIFVQRKISNHYSEQHRKEVEKVVWFSNIGSITYQQKRRYATDLCVVMNDDYTGPLLLPDALTSFGLIYPTFCHLEKLHFFGRGILRSGTDERTPDIIGDAVAFCNFLYFHFRGLTSIKLSPIIILPADHTTEEHNVPAVPTSPVFTLSPCYPLLFQFYFEHLPYFYCVKPVSLFIHQPATLYITTLVLDLRCINRPENLFFSDFNALETIRFLNIHEQVPLFGLLPYSAERPVLPNLKILQLEFKEIHGAQQRTLVQPASLLHSCPKLSELLISRSTRIYQDLYSSFRDAPLRTLSINEDQRTLLHIDTGIIRSIDCLHLETIKPDEGNWWDDPIHYVSRFYSTESAVRRAHLGITVPFPTHICWYNLVSLSLTTDVATVTLIVRLLKQLIILKYLRIMCITMNPHDSDVYFWGSNDREADICAATEPTVVDSARLDGPPDTGSIEAITHSLQVFAIDTPSHFDDESVLKLTLFLPSLQTLFVAAEYLDKVGRTMSIINPGVSVSNIRQADRYFNIDFCE